MPRKLAWAMGSAFTRLGPLDSAIQFVEGGECRFGQREDADRQRERRSFCQIRGRKSGIIGFWGRVPFHGRAVRANDRRRGDLTFLERGKSATNNPSRFVGDLTDGKKKPPTEFQARTKIKKKMSLIQIKKSCVEGIKVTLRL